MATRNCNTRLDDNTLDLLLVVKSDVAPHPHGDESKNADTGRSNAHVAHSGAIGSVDGITLWCAPSVAELSGQASVDGCSLALLRCWKSLSEILREGVLPDGSGDGVADGTTNLRGQSDDSKNHGC